jgi:oxygen-independent coproporphyrinogen-3 oxidase
MGVQALRDPDLRALGRMHSVAEARAAFDVARAIFPAVSFDLIYARERQSIADWRAELTEALTMAVDHLSLYQLTIEPGTRFGDLAARGGLRDLPDDTLAADLYLATQAICDAAGIAGYEISNHARQGAESRHNLIYWRYGDYAGIGPGAHGRLTLDGARVATETLLLPERWLAAVEGSGSGESRRDTIGPTDQAAEMLMMGLRLTEGVDLVRHAALAGAPAPEEALDELTALGLVAVDAGRLRTTAAGRPVLNAILKSILIQ